MSGFHGVGRPERLYNVRIVPRLAVYETAGAMSTDSVEPKSKRNREQKDRWSTMCLPYSSIVA